jgi:trigger factor
MTSLEGWGSAIELHPHFHDKRGSRGHGCVHGVGATGLEPAIFCSQSRRASRYATPRPSEIVRTFRDECRALDCADQSSRPDPPYGRLAEVGPPRRIAAAQREPGPGRFRSVRAAIPGVTTVPSTVEQLSPTRVKITVEVPFADLKTSMDKAYAEVAKSVSIPGFRRGKVPPVVIDQRFGRGVIIQEAFNDSWQRFYGAAVTENNLSPLAQPDVEVTKLEDGDVIEFTAEVDVRPDFDLPDFSTLQAQVDALEVPDTLVDQQLDVLRNRFGSRETVERPAADGDIVTINLVASRDGEPLGDATAEDVEYTIGSGQMLDGLDEAVIGLSAGESATFASKLVSGPWQDEEADVKVTVTKVQTSELPDADDEFAQEASEFDTIEELRADITERLTRIARLEQASQARDAVLETLVGQVEIDVPDNLLNSEIDARRKQISEQLTQAGLTVEQYLADVGQDQTEDEFWADLEDRATQALKAQIILDKVAEDHSVDVDQNDFTQHVVRKAQADGVPPQQVADHLKEHPHHIEEYMLEIRRGKALAMIVESATVTDSNGSVVELAKLQEDGSYADSEALPQDLDGEPAAEPTGEQAQSTGS